jgi:hypothetical protein
MSERTPNNPNEPKAGFAQPLRKLSCEEWEAMLVDFLDGTLPSTDSDSFRSHQKTCASCAEMFSHAERGREWLNFLRVEPQVPVVLVSKILAQTSSMASFANPAGELLPASAAAIPVAPVLPFWQRSSMTLAGRRIAQPRLLMTAAMAFFSITLTLNMAGIRLSAVHLADLKPAAVSSNLDKQYHMASARVVRYYDNLRFVYEMEAKVRELRRDADLENSSPVDKQNQSSPSGAPNKDGNHKSGGKSEGPSARQPQAVIWGDKVEAVLRAPAAQSPAIQHQFPAGSEPFPACTTEANDDRTADQAERGIA